jgi:hypothetical protein
MATAPQVTAPQIVDMSTINFILGTISLSNYYQVNFSGLSPDLNKHLKDYSSADNAWITKYAGLLCAEANLPSSSFATAEVKDNFMGTTQEFAHSRLFTDIDFSFYVDGDYKVLDFFESWMDFISGGGEVSQTQAGSDPFNNGYYRRFVYPDSYKIDSMSIVKFERAAGSKKRSNTLIYRFVNAFPKSITSIPVSYGQADALKVTVTFNYDRYTVGRTSAPYITEEGKKKTPTDLSKYYGPGLPGDAAEQLRQAYESDYIQTQIIDNPRNSLEDLTVFTKDNNLLF